MEETVEMLNRCAAPDTRDASTEKGEVPQLANRTQ